MKIITRASFALTLACTCATKADTVKASLLTDLQEKFSSQGLMIAGVMGRELIVFPFSGSPFIRTFFNYDLGMARISSDGNTVLGYSYLDNPGIPARRIALINTEGRVIGVLNRDVVNIADLAVASDRISVAFAGKDLSTGDVGIFLGRLGTNDARLIVALQSHNGVPQETSIAWAPDVSTVVFSRDNDVSRYDVSSGRISLLLRRGTNPSCSPDGERIGYRSLDGYAMIASRRGTEAKRASRWPISGHVHWSPDSAYYFVDEKIPGVSAQNCPFGTCFVIYRLSDGSRLQLDGSDRKDSFFGWVHGAWLRR